MRDRHLRTLIVAALLLAPVAFVASTAIGSDDDDHHGDHHGDHDVLHEAMEHLGEAFKGIRASIRKPEQNAETLKLVRECQQRVMAAKAALPETIDRAPLDKQEALKTDYAVRMAKLLAGFCELEVDLLEGRQDDAQATYKRLAGMRAKGHEEFKDE